MALALLVPQDRPQTSLLETLAQVDAAAILRSWKIKGVEISWEDGEPRVCLKVENAWPTFLLEALDRGGESMIREAEPVLRVLSALFDGDLRGLAGVSGPAGSNHQMREAHVWGFTPPIVPALGGAQELMVLPPGPVFAPHYLSEADRREWRSGRFDAIIHAGRILAGGGLDARAGSWGSYYPRAGAAILPSAPWMDMLTAVRAGRIPLAPSGRIVVGRSQWETRTGHLLQALLPRRDSAIRIGVEIRTRDRDERGPRRRLYLFMGIFEGCARGTFACDRPRQVPARSP
jgi:hypothetical protein